MSKRPLIFLSFLAWILAGLGLAAAPEGTPGAAETGKVEPGKDYRLRPQDLVEITVFGEPDLAVAQRIDAEGGVSMPLIGVVKLAGMAVREAEAFLEKRYLEEEYLISPQITVKVVDYALRQFFIFGQVRNPGAKPFPLEAGTLDIIEAISMAGDFTEMAKTSSVRVTRKNPGGPDQILTWNLDGILQGNLSSSQTRENFMLYPGDILFVPERVF